MAVGPLSTNQVQALYKERYRKVVPDLLEAEQGIYAKIKKGEVEIVGPRSIRAAKKMKQGGQVRTFAPDGGDLGRGTGAEYQYTSLTPIPLLVALEKTKASMWNTQSEEIAIKNAVREQLKDGASEYGANVDRYWFGDGTGVLAVTSSGVGGATVTCTAPVGTRWLRPGQRYQVYSTNLATNRGVVVVDQVDYPNKQASISGAWPAGSINGDKLLPDGVSGASPTWFYGKGYHISSASSGLWLGLDRSVYPQIRSVVVTSAGALVPAYFRNLKNRMKVLRENIFQKGEWEFVWHPAQEEAYENLGLQISRYEKNGHDGYDAMINTASVTIDGQKPRTSPNQNPSVIDYVNWQQWWRAETIPFGLYTVGDISEFPIYGASGGIAAADVTYMAGIFQWGVDDPISAGGQIVSLSVPTGY